ncbi:MULTISPECIES: hypothetical protein [Hymenobacter]|uniref:Lipoprotein n=1 Tax=Hymenobacter mucosus TaxID=1411120 RepID=A0A238V410_9BACT|nr:MULTISPECIES: hypothetical protein [Hymenobacter]SNR29160.1 hypothetical protein SAMN06269173_101100 [Hymenobacter mucosus]
MLRPVSVLFLAALGLLSSCAVGLLEPVTPPQFAAGGTALPVLGMTPLVPGQRISFGEFQLGKVQRGWTSTRYYPAGVAGPGATGSEVLDVLTFPAAEVFRNSSSKLQFSLQAGPRRADVYCVDRVTSRELSSITPLLGGPLRITRDWKNTFSGFIIGPEVDAVKVWNVLLASSDMPDYRTDPSPVVGVVGRGDSVLLQVRAVVRHTIRHPKTNQEVALPVPMPIGYEIVLEQQPIGFVDFQMPQPRIWLRNNLPAEVRFLTANTAATVMLWGRTSRM